MDTIRLAMLPKKDSNKKINDLKELIIIIQEVGISYMRMFSGGFKASKPDANFLADAIELRSNSMTHQLQQRVFPEQLLS